LLDRKRAEEQIAADEKLTSISGDIETYVTLAAKRPNSDSSTIVLKDLDRELSAAETYTAELETQTLLFGRNRFTSNAIMTIKPARLY